MMHDGSVNATMNGLRCTLWLNSTFWMFYDEEIHFVTSGKVYLNTYLKRELNRREFDGKRLEHFTFKSNNEFPSKTVKFACYDLPNSWSCKEKAIKCKEILKSMMKQTIMGEFKCKPSHDLSQVVSRRLGVYDCYSIFKRNKLISSCTTARKFVTDSFDDGRVLCVGEDKYFNSGRDFCRAYFKCIDEALNAITKYTQESKKCEARYSSFKNDSSAMMLKYGYRDAFAQRYESVKTQLTHVEPGVPLHFLLQCGWRQSLIQLTGTLEDPEYKTNIIFCQRKTSKITKAFSVIPTCERFVDECVKAFKCLNSRRRCNSAQFGHERLEGFLMTGNDTNVLLRGPQRCTHWGVELIHSADRNLHCKATKYFKLKGLTFCKSYEWACLKLYNCATTREICIYHPDKKNDVSTREHPELGIINFQMPKFSTRENPRPHVPNLFKCNKKLGYPHRVFLFFTTTVCMEKFRKCNLNMSTFDSMSNYRVGSLLTMAAPGQTLHFYRNNPEDLIHIWSCKRDSFSSVSCNKFLKICETIKACVMDGSNIEDVTVDLPLDDTCYSPSPVNTLKPTTINAVAGKWHHPGTLSETISYVLPLEKTYPRIFGERHIGGWHPEVSASVRNTRRDLFFNLFLEDCRYKHQFEGFLLEPYLSEVVDYLICSVPFGMPRQKENPLVAKGCKRIQRACEEMKKCYIHHREYFGFHEFINRNVFNMGIIMMIIFVPSLTLTIITQYLYPVNTPGI